MIRIIESKTHKLGYQVGLRFQITQHIKDKLLMENIVNYLKCGYISARGDILDFKVTKFNDILKIILPIFDKYPLLGVKHRDFQAFKLAADLISKKEHLTAVGLSKIRDIKSAMNKGRDAE